jgi:hypothetical protein
LSDHWTGFALDQAFEAIRDDIHEVRDEAKAERTELKQRIEAVADQCRLNQEAVMTRLEKQDFARDTARLETRKAILAFAGVLLTAIIAAGGAIVVALLAGGPT